MLFGVSAVQLYLLNTVILFLSREAIRRSTLRFAAPVSAAHAGSMAARIYERTVLFNLSWLSIVASIPLCFIVRALFLASAPSFAVESSTNGMTDAAASAAAAVASARSMQLSAEYIHCLNLYTLSSWIELLAEPLYIFGQKQQQVRFRVVVDGIAVLARCVTTFLCLMWAANSSSSAATGSTGGGSLLAFAYGQMMYACVIVLGWYSQCKWTTATKAGSSKSSVLVTRFIDVLPQRLPALPADSVSSSSTSLIGRYLDPSLLRLTGEVSLQSIEKLLLQEGEKLVLVSLAPAGGVGNLNAQGVYGLVQNLGSLVARMVFQPLEEAAFMEFSIGFAAVTALREQREAAAAANSNASVKTVAVESSSSNSASSSPSSSSSSTLSAAYSSGVSQLGLLLHGVSLLGLVLVCFGPGYSYVFLDLLYGSRWSTGNGNAPGVLSIYCVYLLWMSVNGVSESFVSGVISTIQLRHYNQFLVGFSVVYIATCAVANPIAGSLGLIAANMVNMSMRIAYSSWFIKRFFEEGETTMMMMQQQDQQQSQSRGSSMVRELWVRILPDSATLCACLLSFLLTQISLRVLAIEGSHSLLRFGIHISVGVFCLAMVAATIWKRERTFIAQMKGLATKRKKQ